MNEINSFRKGIADGIPICLGYLAVSFAFGISAANMGLSVLETLLISMTNVTSAGQLAAVPIIAAGGSFIELAATQLIINLRYSLMSVSLSQKLSKNMTLLHRFIISFVNTDEVFAVASAQRGNVGKNYLYGLILTPYLGWSSGTLLGSAAGGILPEILISSLGIAIYGMFVAIVVPDARRSMPVALCAIVSAALSCVFSLVPFLKTVQPGFVIIICSVIASALFAFLFPVKTETDDQTDSTKETEAEKV